MLRLSTSFLVNDCALALAEHYVAIVPNSAVTGVFGSDDAVVAVDFTLNGVPYNAINAGQDITPSTALSLTIHCDTQADVDYYWERLTEGGSEGPCGWLVDKFGMSWQVVPTAMGAYLGDPNPARAQAAMTAMRSMKKLDLALFAQAVADVA